MKKLLIAFMLCLGLTSAASAQKTKAALTTEVNTNLASNNNITAAILRTTILDIINSYYDLNGLTTVSCGSNTFVNAFPTLSSAACTQPTVANISGFGTDVAAFLTTPSSANLAAAVTDETGTGLVVFGTAPNITAPTGIVKADVGLGNVANTDTTNATNISSGTLAKARGGTGGVNGALAIVNFGANTAVAPAATVFYGPGFSGASDAQYAMIPVAGVLSNFTVQTNAAPNGIQTFTITLNSGAAGTAITCTITGSAQTCTDNVHTLSVAQGSFLSVKMVASASAVTSTGNYFAVAFTPN